ncbi:MAG TPA: VTT domain-containing protein [Candidatus Dormibacteraeota bacterium]|nr:VTT domain-containing protein [Candidatus Dormibacteraeota bacterium]
MTTLHGIHGAVAVVLLCALAFVEEAGVPLPMLPGDLLLMISGILIANGAVDWRAMVPALFVLSAAGAVVAFLWARAIGGPGLRALARRLGVEPLMDRATERLKRTGAIGVFVSRIIPGLRVNASLAAGAGGMALDSFVLGLVPAVVVWGGLFIVLGVLVGVPAEALLTKTESAVLSAAILLALGASTYVGIRHIPANRSTDVLAVTRPRWRHAAALGLDVVVVANLSLALTELFLAEFGIGGPDGVVDLAVVVAAITLGYVAATRLGVGGTAGERLFDVSYHPLRRHASRRDAGP